MILNDKEYQEFERYVTTQYLNVNQEDVHKVVLDEFSAMMEYRHSTKNNRESALKEALANCRGFLSEPRKQLTHIDLVSHRLAKNFFNAISKEEVKP